MDTTPEVPPSPPAVEDTVTFKRSHFYGVLVVLAFAAGILVGYLAWGRGAGTSANGRVAAAPSGQQAAPQPTQRVVRYDIPTEGYPAIGAEDAEIVIVEFSDFQCPFCKKWHDEVYGPLMDAYPGQIRLVYRNFPLTNIHGDAFSAAEAAQCARDQGKFWEFHDKLFSGQYGLGEEAYLQYAADLGLDEEAFRQCLTEHKYQEFVQDDMNFAINLGVRSTPTFFINGLPIVGAQPLTVFTTVVDQELAGEIPK
ncbi:MAG: DsbA family protein [Anaerolineae bacterium]|nr:MAG: DsbA family protein [Anaerolineae bacterium]